MAAIVAVVMMVMLMTFANIAGLLQPLHPQQDGVYGDNPPVVSMPSTGITYLGCDGDGSGECGDGR